MVYILLDENGFVQQVDRSGNHPEGYIEAPDDVVAGQYKQGNEFVNPPPEPPSAQMVGALRRVAYIEFSDPLFFRWQRDEATKEEWLEKIEEIKQLYPKG